MTAIAVAVGSGLNELGACFAKRVVRPLPEACSVRGVPWYNPANSKTRCAFTQGSVTPVRNVVGALFLFGSPGTERGNALDPENARLAPGKYLLKAYLDGKNRLVDAPTVLLGDDDFYGQAEIEARWGEGFPQAEKIPGQLLK